MIPPADGLNEMELALLYNIAKEVGEQGYIIYTFVHRPSMKSLCELGVIGVATVTHSPWINSSDPLFCADGFKVWVTEKGHAYMRGEINVAKDCTLEHKYFSVYKPICKRHEIRHTKEEYEEANSLSSS